MPLLLKQLLDDCGISLTQLAALIKKPDGQAYAKSTISYAVSGQRLPKNDPAFRRKVERAVGNIKCVVSWLAEREYAMADLWREQQTETPCGLSIHDELSVEVQMFTQQARKHFRLDFKDPFRSEIRDREDIFMSEEARYMYHSMKAAAMDGGFMAVVGEVGSGKSLARKWLEAELERMDDVRVIQPRALDKSRLTDSSILDAMVFDLSHEAPKSGPEKKGRQVVRLLKAASRDGVRVVLVIEEAQDLTLKAFKVLKRLHEIEDGYKKTLGIIMIGQPELGVMLDERSHHEMREVIRRVTVARIHGLNGSLPAYLDHKFARAGLDRRKAIADDAIAAMSARLTSRGESLAYPLTVNNFATLAMNEAAALGEPLVTAAVVDGLKLGGAR